MEIYLRVYVSRKLNGIKYGLKLFYFIKLNEIAILDLLLFTPPFRCTLPELARIGLRLKPNFPHQTRPSPVTLIFSLFCNTHISALYLSSPLPSLPTTSPIHNRDRPRLTKRTMYYLSPQPSLSLYPNKINK